MLCVVVSENGLRVRRNEAAIVALDWSVDSKMAAVSLSCAGASLVFILL